MELGVRYYDNSSSTGTIFGGEQGMLREHGYRERARGFKDGMMGHSEFTGVRFMRKAPLMLEVKVSSRSTIRNLRRKESRYFFWRNFFSTFNLMRGLSVIWQRLNPFASYHAQVRWNTR